MTEIRSAYSERQRVYALPSGDSMTQQSFAESCDINNIMAKYQKTGVVDHVAKFNANYHDCSSLTFTESQMIIASAQNMFNELPAAARKAFNNQPAEFLDFVDNLDEDTAAAELHALGLLAEGATIPLSVDENVSEELTEAPKREETTEPAPKTEENN